MRKRILRRKPFVVDGQSFEVSVTAVYDKVVHLRLTLKARFGTQSYCTIRGLSNTDYYYNYGHWRDATEAISITPQMIAALIRYAMQTGWSPEASRSNHTLLMTNETARLLVSACE